MLILLSLLLSILLVGCIDIDELHNDEQKMTKLNNKPRLVRRRDDGNQAIGNHLNRQNNRKRQFANKFNSTAKQSKQTSEYKELIPQFSIVNASKDYPCILRNESSDGSFREYRIVVTSTKSYLPTFMNWFMFYYNICPNAQYLYIICFDEGMDINYRKLGFACNYTHAVPSAGAHNRIWLIRAQITQRLLKAGYDVLLADSDAIWLRNPFKQLSKYPNSQIIASRASYPEDIHERLGATLCMGFAYFKTSQSMLKFWDEIIFEMKVSKSPDDQRVVNHFMMKQGLTYPTKLTYLKGIQDDTGSFHIDRVFKYSITLISHHDYRRSCFIENQQSVLQSTIAHCSTTGKTVSAKASAAANFGLWKLKRGWQNYDNTNHSFDKLIQFCNISHKELQS